MKISRCTRRLSQCIFHESYTCNLLSEARWRKSVDHTKDRKTIGAHRHMLSKNSVMFHNSSLKTFGPPHGKFKSFCKVMANSSVKLNTFEAM